MEEYSTFRDLFFLIKASLHQRSINAQKLLCFLLATALCSLITENLSILGQLVLGNKNLREVNGNSGSFRGRSCTNH